MIQNTLRIALFFLLIGRVIPLLAQSNSPYCDTIHQFAIDSLQHDLGKFIPATEKDELSKRIKYIGEDTIWIQKAWTGDPHFICDWPKEPLRPNKVYEIKICFFHKGRRGRLSKKMGLLLSNGERITFHFTGRYVME